MDDQKLKWIKDWSSMRYLNSRISTSMAKFWYWKKVFRLKSDRTWNDVFHKKNFMSNFSVLLSWCQLRSAWKSAEKVLKNYSSKKLCKLLKHNYERTLKLDPSKILIDIVPIGLALKKVMKKKPYFIAQNDWN